MISSTFFSSTEYHREREAETTKANPLQWLKSALPALAAWINADTDTYRMRGQDTLTFGDQMRWFQLKGMLATTAELQDKTAPISDLSEVVKEYDELVRFLSNVRTTRAVAAPLAASPTARQALRLGNNAAAIALLEEWLEDTSGYDEAVWPQVKTAIEENRLSTRTRFGE